MCSCLVVPQVEGPLSLVAYGPTQPVEGNAHPFPPGIPVHQAQGVQVVQPMIPSIPPVGHPAANQALGQVNEDIVQGPFPVIMQLQAEPLLAVMNPVPPPAVVPQAPPAAVAVNHADVDEGLIFDVL